MVKVGNRSKQIDGKTYHLVGLKMDRAALLGVGDMIDVATVVNGELGARMFRQPDPEETLPGNLLVAALVWLRLPESGRLEYLSGLISMPPGKASQDPKVLRELLIRSGYEPFTIDVDQIPAVRPKTMEELAEVLDRQAAPATRPATAASHRQGILSVAKLAADPLEIGGKEYWLMALKFDPTVMSPASGASWHMTLVNGEHPSGSSPRANDRLPDGLLLLRRHISASWLAAPTTDEVEFLYGETEAADPKGDTQRLRSIFLSRGFVPVVFKTKDIPQAKPGITAEELDQILAKGAVSATTRPIGDTAMSRPQP